MRIAYVDPFAAYQAIVDAIMYKFCIYRYDFAEICRYFAVFDVSALYSCAGQYGQGLALFTEAIDETP